MDVKATAAQIRHKYESDPRTDSFNAIIYGGLGSGKTFAFQVGALVHVAYKALLGPRRVRVLFLYPRVVLAANQFSELFTLVAETSKRLPAGVDLAAFPVLHFATHAVASTRDPRKCAVILSGGEKLGIDRIVEMKLARSLVVLSGCRTAEGELVPGEGVVGLAWAFIRAGAGAVLVSQWNVDDQASARLMVSFHRHLQKNGDPVSAIASARREMAAETGHPASWAPFVLVLRPGSL